MSEFDQYKGRNIKFQGLHITDGWALKIYTISMHEHFQSHTTLQSILSQLDSLFLSKARQSTLPTHHHAFLIIHEAREGVWILFNWWIGGEMIESEVFFSSYSTPRVISKNPHTGALVCVWELEVIIHERQAWITHVLKNASDPEFSNYQKDIMT